MRKLNEDVRSYPVPPYRPHRSRNLGKLVALLVGVLLLLTVACDPGEIFGPNTAKVTIVITSRIQGDELVPFINGEAYEPRLSDTLPSFQYRPRVQADEAYYSQSSVERGRLYISAWSMALGKMSRVKSTSFQDDRVYSFEFGPTDFR
jgi:hypothetical protein